MNDGFWMATWVGRDGGAVVAGFEVRHGKVTDEVAPILKWARNKPAVTLDSWVQSKGGFTQHITAYDTLF